ncbi:MAG TPA: serine hydrolase [Gemmatimonadota bacterium]|nr:serine hydrolase [Gemmatimonadota bacterium]
MTKPLALVLAIPWILAPAREVPAQEIDLAGLDAEIEATREAWRIPGLAVAIVKDDSILLAKGYGARDVGRPGPIDAETLFAIGSATKAFTAAAIGILVDEGRLGWDDRVAERLPGFALHDPYASAEITIRDLLAHRSGLPMANLMWLGGQLDREEMVRRLRYLEPATGFRAGFGYQNALYLTAGLIIQEVTGRTWDAFVTDRILRPLGMERTNTSVDSLAGLENVAAPHARVDGEPRPVPYRDIDHVGPAGSIHSSAADMARWLRFQLAGGVAEGRRLLEEATLAETHGPQIVLRRESILARLYPNTHVLAYGMGWLTSDYHGKLLLDHGGGIDGMTSLVGLLPEEGLGVALLTNFQLPMPPYWLLYSIIDRFLGQEPKDWSGEFQAMAQELDGSSEPERVPGTRPSLPIERYAGTYENPPLGAAGIALESSGLAFRYGTMEAALEHWHRDTFRADWRSAAWQAAAGPGWVTFRLDRKGEVAGLVLEAIPGEEWDFDRTTR